ncbi:hypothetical protein [Leeuwenhoekiella parthenopeia]|uniref:Uncharacterized protein n=1 Tax=Leeuwenhoekiella parthenopeia TaxID=2890320 RepID=A0ABS8GQ41_9FLAO|nr:hypothetical protein [Leeuwenhoekiella parthenopeia]MCC4211276.1 hypothetical protein [Leeuwenhoekiella parthenopeia]
MSIFKKASIFCYLLFLCCLLACKSTTDGQTALNSNLKQTQEQLELESNYSGRVQWDKDKGQVTFLTSGSINFENQGVKSFIWNVPKSVKHIVIEANTTVNGAFHTYAPCLIEGKNRKTSVVYGTEIQSWPQKHDVIAYVISSFETHEGELVLKNLTSLNPRSFHVRGLYAPVHLKSCDFIDTRGGSGNHSDGIAGGDGSTVDDCYFETGDDVIKVYNDILVTNTTINMVKNAVPIQLGWGDYPDGAVGTFRNIKIIGNSGRGNPQGSNPIIAGRSGEYTVTVNIDGMVIDNPNASMVNLWDDGNDGVYEKTLKGTLKNVEIIQIQRYTNHLLGNDALEIFDKEGNLIGKNF